MKIPCALVLAILVLLTGSGSEAADRSYPPAVGLDEVMTLLAQAPRHHPRLLATSAELRTLKEKPADGSLRQGLNNEVMKQAERLLGEPPVERELEGRRLLGKSRTCLGRVLVLATAFHLTGREEFVRRCEREMLAAADFTDWNPSHFLDVGEMSLALAMGYDWLYAELAADSRARIRRALVEKSLRLPFETRHNGWVRASNNWGQVCHAGLTAAALAILEDEPELAARTVTNAVNNVHFSMDAYAPRGSYPEGPGYWSYGTSFNVILIAALEGVLGTDFGLSQAPGFDQTGQYLPLVTGPSGLTFNYADGGAGRGPEPALHWFARRYGRGDWLRGEAELIRTRPSRGGRLMPLTLLWLDEGAMEAPNRMPLNWYGGGSVPISIHRSGWEDPDRVFLGFKGGSPSANHGNMDIGSFVLESQGVRWALDLGAEGYHGIESRGMNLWARGQDSDRWTIFRQMNHSHNTLVIDDQLQRAAGFGRFERFSERPELPVSVIDMTSVYEGQAKSVRRGVALLASGQVVIQDELAGLRPGADVRWAMLTRAEPGPVGGRTVQLREGNAALVLEIATPIDGVAWTTVDSASPRREWDSPNRGTVMVVFHARAPDDGALTLRVVASPGSHRSRVLEPRVSGRLANWPGEPIEADGRSR